MQLPGLKKRSTRRHEEVALKNWALARHKWLAQKRTENPVLRESARTSTMD